jgi:hypothetical protein
MFNRDLKLEVAMLRSDVAQLRSLYLGVVEAIAGRNTEFDKQLNVIRDKLKAPEQYLFGGGEMGSLAAERRHSTETHRLLLQLMDYLDVEVKEVPNHAVIKRRKPKKENDE